MSVPEYQDKEPLKVSESLSLERLAGKSVLITGGAGGLGKAYATAFIQAGSYVTIADVNEKLGAETVAEMGENSQFIKCDVTNWDDQVRAFEAASKNSPYKSCDIVIANAGIPNLKTMEINLMGLLYTVKLALHYFRRQPVDSDRDRCLILKSSLAGYVDLPGSIQYNSSKFGVRGVMRSLRRTSWKENIRVNLVAPW
ncbi:hypothetical protein AYO21_09299 [Fonsecaea monophora]|uniref:Uncharacterized protein n=1 Tax=Fonsecaea monophora TaxID=254056 RepID=A0A177EZM0_9EURO|nr:hypothetical protein AYO21_09299 [Fonsecaea monophora]OAG36492.1 hypothetical protein AYO21_09299 [Fonsecaea monophora]